MLALKVQVVRAALELEVIPAVAAGHRDAESVARATGCSLRRDANPARRPVRPRAAALVRRRLLTHPDERRRISSPGSPRTAPGCFLDDLRAGDHFTENIRTGQVLTDFASADATGLWVAYAASDLLTWPDDVAAYRARWSAIGVTPASVPGARVLDVGCGSAIVSLVLALDDPTATVTGIDRGPVVEVAGRLAEAMGVASRASFVAGDVTTLGTSTAPSTSSSWAGVLHFLDPIEIGSTLRQVHRLLAPSGRIVIREVLPTPGVFDDPDPYLMAVWLFNVARRGRVYTFEEYAAMLAEAGFGPVRRLEGHAVAPGGSRRVAGRRQTGSFPARRGNTPARRRVARGEWSGRRVSNPRHAAWKAAALPTELLPPGACPPTLPRGRRDPYRGWRSRTWRRSRDAATVGVWSEDRRAWPAVNPRPTLVRPLRLATPSIGVG